jgi:carbon monoxide dehydrogenase subunit G
MQMTGQRTLPVPPQTAWAALNDPDMLKACIAGCESMAMTEPYRYELVMAARIGPVAARFRGRLTQSEVIEPQSYRIDFDGQGGAAGFGKGSAAVRLTPTQAGTQLDYEVTAQIGGKLAQVGSRLLDGAARKIADDFFASFEARLIERVHAPSAGLEVPQAPRDSGLVPPPAGPEPQTLPTRPDVPTAGGLAAAAERSPNAEASPAPAPPPAAEPQTVRNAHRNRWIGWAIGTAAAVAGVLLWWFTR